MTRLIPFDEQTHATTRWANVLAHKLLPALQSGLLAPDLKPDQFGFSTDPGYTVYIVDTGGCATTFYNDPPSGTLPTTFPATKFLSHVDNASIIKSATRTIDNQHDDFPKWHLWVKYATVFAAACTFTLMALYKKHKDKLYVADTEYIWAQWDACDLMTETHKVSRYTYLLDLLEVCKTYKTLNAAATNFTTLLTEAYKALGPWPSRHLKLMKSFADRACI